FQAEDGIRDFHVTGVQTCALPIFPFASAKEVFAETQGSAAAATAADVAGLRSRACAIADTLAGLLGESLQLTFTDNTSTMVSFRSEERRVGKEVGARLAASQYEEL